MKVYIVLYKYWGKPATFHSVYKTEEDAEKNIEVLTELAKSGKAVPMERYICIEKTLTGAGDIVEQSKKASLIESVVQQVLSFGIGIGLQFFIYTQIFGLEINAVTTTAALSTVMIIECVLCGIKAYYVRRLFANVLDKKLQ